MSKQNAPNIRSVQCAVDCLVNANEHEREQAFRQLATSLLQCYNHEVEGDSISELLSPELPPEVQRFSAAWLLRTLVHSPAALDFGNTLGRTAALFDSAFRKSIYPILKIDEREPTFKKIPSLIDYAMNTIRKARELSENMGNLSRLEQNRQDFQQLLNSKRTRPFLLSLFPRHLTKRDVVTNLFDKIESYINDTNGDPSITRDAAYEACANYENDAKNHGTCDANEILGGIAQRLKIAVKEHFASLEESEHPHLVFSAIEKRYPLEQYGAEIIFKIKIANEGSGPVRNLSLEEVVFVDAPLEPQTTSTALGTIQANDDIVISISATVSKPCSQADLIAEFSWIRPGGKETIEEEFTIIAQKADVDWERVEESSPYSLEAVTTGDDLIGRKVQLKALLRLANLKTVGSAFIYGQKRVGKTSLANVLAERLENAKDKDWIVIQKGSGDYMGSDAESTLKQLGEVLVSEMQKRILGLSDLSLDFTSGLSPLSSAIDKALEQKDLRLLFILDEFDDLPLELLRRTNLSASLFQVLRQSSNKAGCGFILIGGEKMEWLLNAQGDRLNKFNAFSVDYFDKSNDWSDFIELIRKPVQDWLTINDDAMNQLFMHSAGNPYFAKLIAHQLFVNMVSLRHSNASKDDMNTAFDDTVTQIKANSFTHFWTDDIVQNLENTEKTMLERRSVLIGTGHAFRQDQHPVSEEIILNEVKKNETIGIESAKIVLQDFIRRGILIEDKGHITAKIPLFKVWLKEEGVGVLLADLKEMDYMSARLKQEERIRVTDNEILDAVERLGLYRGRSLLPVAVRKWLGQFDTLEDQRLMYTLLSNVKVYHEEQVRHKMREAFDIVKRNIRTVVKPSIRVRRDVAVSYLDTSEAKSGPMYCRLFRDENRMSSDSFLTLEAFKRKMNKEHEFQKLVLLDDFSGTGKNLVEGLEQSLEILRRANKQGVRVVVIVVVGFTEARINIERFIVKHKIDADIHFCDELGDEDKAFSSTSRIFPDSEQRYRAKEIAEEKGVAIEPRCPLGFGDMEASIVFYQSCPNNTLPIFWSARKEWFPLFPRF